MQLSKDDPRHLTIPRAREMLQHLRQINEKAGEQRDIEEIAPGASLAGVSAEDLDAARKAKLDAADLLALGEIAAAAAQAPSENFPDSPLPVAEIDFHAAMIVGRSAPRLQSAKLATFLLDGESTPERAGARVEALGHIRLRQENLHPADNPRALFHLRRDAGISADQARQLGNLGRWATAWLNPTPAKAEAAPVAGAPAEPARPFRMERFSVEVHEAALKAYRQECGDEHAVNARLSGTTTIEGEAWPPGPTETIRTDWEGYPRAEIRLTSSDHGRWAVSLSTEAGGPNYSGQGSPPYVYSRDPIFPSRADALAYAAERIVRRLGDEWGRKRKLQAWLTAIQIEAEPAEQTGAPAPASDPEQPRRDLSPAHVRILREVAHALAANDGQPVPVFRYWLDANAVELWKWEPSPLLEFRAEPGEAWTVDLTPAGREALDVINEDFDPGVVAMWVAQGGYKTAWLTPATEEAGEPQPEGLPTEESPFEPTPIRDEVLDALRSGTPDFVRLLALAGLEGPFECKVDGTVSGANQAEAGTVDPWRNLTDDVADARAAACRSRGLARPTALLTATNRG